MKKIIYICLSSGCDKLLNHGSPADTVAEDKATPSLMNASDMNDTDSSIRNLVCNMGISVVALFLFGNAVYRYFRPEIEPISAPEPKTLQAVNITPQQINDEGYKRCYYACDIVKISSLCFF
jgi:hypothetical protein